MKIKRKALEEHIRSAIKEAAEEGRMQKVYRKSFANMIDKAEEGDNPNTPPFTKKAAGPGRSGPIVEQIDEILYEGAFEAAASAVKKGLTAIAREFKLTTQTGKLLRKVFGGTKLSTEEYEVLEKGLNNLAIPAMIVGGIVGGRYGAGLMTMLGILSNAFFLPELHPSKWAKTEKSNEPDSQ